MEGHGAHIMFSPTTVTRTERVTAGQVLRSFPPPLPGGFQGPGATVPRTPKPGAGSGPVAPSPQHPVGETDSRSMTDFRSHGGEGPCWFKPSSPDTQCSAGLSQGIRPQSRPPEPVLTLLLDSVSPLRCSQSPWTLPTLRTLHQGRPWNAGSDRLNFL